MKNKSIKLRYITVASVLCAFVAVCTQISFPLPTGVPVTLQTLAVSLCGYMLPLPYAILCIGVYLMLGAVGLPVFSFFSGGFGKLIGPTGGFLWGFLVLALCCAINLKTQNKILTIVIKILFGVLGLTFCHFAGVLQYSAIAGIPIPLAFLRVSVPFILKDIISVVLAYFIASSKRIKKIIALNEL